MLIIHKARIGVWDCHQKPQNKGILNHVYYSQNKDQCLGLSPKATKQRYFKSRFLFTKQGSVFGTVTKNKGILNHVYYSQNKDQCLGLSPKTTKQRHFKSFLLFTKQGSVFRIVTKNQKNKGILNHVYYSQNEDQCLGLSPKATKQRYFKSRFLFTKSPKITEQQ